MNIKKLDDLNVTIHINLWYPACIVAGWVLGHFFL